MNGEFSVFMLPAWRGILGAMDRQPALHSLRRFPPLKRDTPLYAQSGFAPPARPERGMERLLADPYSPTRDPEQTT